MFKVPEWAEKFCSDCGQEVIVCSFFNGSQQTQILLEPVPVYRMVSGMDSTGSYGVLKAIQKSNCAPIHICPKEKK